MGVRRVAVAIGTVLAMLLAVPATAQNDQVEPGDYPMTITCVDAQTYASAAGTQTVSIVLGRGGWTRAAWVNATLVATLRTAAYGPVVMEQSWDYNFTLSDDQLNVDPPLRWVRELNITAPPGRYEFTATLWPAESTREPTDYSWWGYSGQNLHVGPVPHLGHQNTITDRCAARSLDLTGDGVDDLRITGGNTSDQYRIQAASWMGQIGDDVESWLSLTFHPPSRRAAGLAYLDGDAARSILGTANLTEVAIQAGPATRLLDNGSFEIILKDHLSVEYRPEDQNPEIRLTAHGSNPIPPSMRQLGFSDGRSLYLNLTLGDFDGDGQPDLYMWAINGTDPLSAADTPPEKRRGEATKLNVRIIVEETENATLLRFELIRYDGGHEGAWIELIDPDRLFVDLFDGNRSVPELDYSLDLPPDEGFVQRDGDTVWVWVSHFSARTLTIVVPHPGHGLPADPKGEPPSETPDETTKDGPVGLTVPLVAVGAAALVAMHRRRLR